MLGFCPELWVLASGRVGRLLRFRAVVMTLCLCLITTSISLTLLTPPPTEAQRANALVRAMADVVEEKPPAVAAAEGGGGEGEEEEEEEEEELAPLVKRTNIIYCGGEY